MEISLGKEGGRWRPIKVDKNSFSVEDWCMFGSLEEYTNSNAEISTNESCMKKRQRSKKSSSKDGMEDSRTSKSYPSSLVASGSNKRKKRNKSPDAVIHLRTTGNSPSKLEGSGTRPVESFDNSESSLPCQKHKKKKLSFNHSSEGDPSTPPAAYLGHSIHDATIDDLVPTVSGQEGWVGVSSTSHLSVAKSLLKVKAKAKRRAHTRSHHVLVQRDVSSPVVTTSALPKRPCSEIIQQGRRRDQEESLLTRKHGALSSNQGDCMGQDNRPASSDMSAREEDSLDDMVDWKVLGVSVPILRALKESNFLHPTPIQAAAVPGAILTMSDVIGAAETGSGKTLAYGVPVLENILCYMRNDSKQDDPLKPLRAMILTPTRELALQVCKNMAVLSKYSSICCVAVVGGFSVLKQNRLLGLHPQVVVATPGRLWALIQDRQPHLTDLSHVRALVVDEADKMVEQGHYQEIREIVQRIRQTNQKCQSFVFSATLTLPKRHHRYCGKSAKQSTIQKLVDSVGLSPKAKVYDLSSKHVTPVSLDERRLCVSKEDRDVYLYYCLLFFPGKKIVFVNNISWTYRLVDMLSALELNPLQLHAGKQQRQRVKCLEQFSSRDNGLLVTTDLAARGIDFSDVHMVIHYDAPRDPDLYFNRCGRTARSNAGTSVLFETSEYTPVLEHILQASKRTHLPALNVDSRYLESLRERVRLAQLISTTEREQRDQQRDARLRRELESDSDEDNRHGKPRTVINTRMLHRRLKQLLLTAITPKGFSYSYPTMSGLLSLPIVMLNSKHR